MSIKHLGKRLTRWVATIGLVLACFCLASCKTHSTAGRFAELPDGVAGAAPSKPAPVLTAGPAAAPVKNTVSHPVAGVAIPTGLTNSPSREGEVLRVGDSLKITMTDTPVVIPPFEEKIREDGTVTLINNETFKAEGKTTRELEKEIRPRYVPGYFKQMTVTVTHQESTRWYYVYGEVKSPARQIYTSRITVLKAIASCAGFTDFANKKNVQLTRVDGRTFKINCIKAQTDPVLDLEVYPGDTILVHRRFW
jgi:protein involved in polysaccharide export with SLBB domain